MEIINQIKKELKEKSDPRAISGESRFFKHKIKHYGIKTIEVQKISKKFFESIKPLTKEDIFDLCEKLFSSGYMEEATIAANWVYRLRKSLTTSDLDTFEKWIDSYIDNWAKCDDFCNHSVGFLVEKFPHLVTRLKKWALSKNMWLRRASAVSLIAPARKGLFLNDVFQISDVLLLDKEDMVQKGYGWLLKVASNKHEKEVYDYVLKNNNVMPRTSLRYSIEKMPPEMRKKAMEK